MCNIFDPISPLIQEDPDLIPGSLIPNYHSVVINDFVLDCVQGLGGDQIMEH